MSLNKVMLIGNVGKDPEIRYVDNTQNATSKVATFSLATSERYKDRNGEIHENTEWHNIVVWRGLADVVEKYVQKGTQLYIEGRIKSRSWNDQNNIKRYTTEVVADNMQILSKKSDNNEISRSQTSAYQNSNTELNRYKFEDPSVNNIEDNKDDLPF